MTMVLSCGPALWSIMPSVDLSGAEEVVGEGDLNCDNSSGAELIGEGDMGGVTGAPAALLGMLDAPAKPDG